jgi:hypothetical protein
MTINNEPTGWPPGMLQDDSRELSQALASKPDARMHAREAAEAWTDEQILSVCYDTIGYDGGLQTVNESDLLQLGRALASPQSSPVAPDVEGLKAECKRLERELCDVERRHCIGKAAVFDVRHAREELHAAIDALSQRAADSHADYMRLLREKQQAGIDALSAHGVKQPEPADPPLSKRYLRECVERKTKNVRSAFKQPKEQPIHEARPDDRKEQT